LKGSSRIELERLLAAHLLADEVVVSPRMRRISFSISGRSSGEIGRGSWKS
jgi:hypothetical protein